MRRWLTRASLCLALLVGLALPAQALAGNACNYSTSQVFSPWGDTAQYYLVPGGNFETSNSKWIREGDATVVSTSSPLGGSKAMRVRDGGRVTTPSFCVTADSPTVRLFLRDPGTAGAVIRVESIWTTSYGTKVTVKVGEFSSTTSGWRLSPIMLLWANLTAMTDSQGKWQMQFRFTAVSGDWRIDDVYVDPFRRV